MTRRRSHHFPCVLGLALLLASVATASDIRIANWNMFNRPNSSSDRTALRTVIQAMGAEVIGGAARPVDILVMQETDTSSSADTRTDFNIVYGVGSYAVQVTAPDGGGDRTGFVYNTATVQLIGTTVVGGMTHPALRGQFRPVGTNGEADFYVYAIHLKSGNSGSDRSRRASEANTVRANANALGSAAVIYAGDFNWQNSFEGAWGNFLAPGDGQAFDPVNAPGSWRDNIAFIDLHSQDPRGGMDDRFDLQLITDELFDNEGLDYIDGSYRVFGNNGTHTLNGSITSGTGAAPNVLSALVTVSDHLPVVLDYVIVVAAPLGDVNCDGAVNSSDIDCFVQAIVSGVACDTCSLEAADTNGDGSLNSSDIDTFVDCVLNGGC